MVLKYKLLFFFFNVFVLHSKSQVINDTLTNFNTDSVIVQALYSNVQWKEAPFAVSKLNVNTLQNGSNTSLLPAFNAVSGVRLEERSPGSVRLSIRGSVLRSPFGVRNIKVYWNDLPLSDGGGNTYFNLIEMQNLLSVEIIKGAAASVYGAGTGGVVLLQSNLPFTAHRKTNLEAAFTVGSFGLLNQLVKLNYQNKKFNFQLIQNHTQSNGYREQSAMEKNNFQLNVAYQANQHIIEFNSFYTALNYQTPGGITFEQMQQNPKLSRQATATLPSAKQQQTAVYNHTLFAGIHYKYSINKIVQLQNAVAISKTNFENPFITNYEKRRENNTALSSKLFFQKKLYEVQLNWVSGFEYLINNSAIQNFSNKNGFADSLFFSDAVKANQWFVFSQLNIKYKKINLQIGLSANEQWYSYKRLSDFSNNTQESSTKIVLAPRAALSFAVTNNISVYSAVAKGFSPPTLAEIKPSDGNFYSNLQAEYGLNIELGVKGNLMNNKLLLDIALYSFNLKNAIVRRNNAAGNEFFINAGSTKQQGLETAITYKILHQKNKFIRLIEWKNNNSFQPYTFTNYTVGTTNFSGNALTGVPQNIHVNSLQILFKNQFQFFVQHNYTSAIPLNDANDVFATSYQLVQLKFTYPILLAAYTIQSTFGIDNVLNEQYSLGNDINAAGRRFFNPAPTRNFFAGISIRLN